MTPFRYIVASATITVEIKLAQHSPPQEANRGGAVAIAHAGDGVDPDVIYKGGVREEIVLQSRPIEVETDWPAVKAFLDATRQGEQFIVDARNVPLVGYEYRAIRIGNAGTTSLHHGRYARLDLRLQSLGAI